MQLLKIKNTTKIKGSAHKRGRIRCCLLGMAVMGIFFGLIKFEVNQVEMRLIQTAEAAAPPVINCNLKIDPMLESVLEN